MRQGDGLKTIGRAFVLVGVLVLALSVHAVGKTLLQDQIQFGRLSQDPSNWDPLFDVVVAGTPSGNFVALLSRGDGACVLEIVSAPESKVVFTATDRFNCADEYEHEDGYTLGHAYQFREFLAKSFKILAPLLTQFKIDYSQFPDSAEIRNADKSRQCAKLAGLRLCKSKDKRVTVELGN